ncbi:MAG TPA: isoprenyl transferase [Syntrophomonadaceae bacterium]|nr:isoprenyl transferase [Syntrophomonadaceae bacterium]HRX20321.1 isoprenyl transferase [Syntrophomonadaceae bacterium]
MDRKEYEKRVDFKKLPEHIAIIMDGNGRWANRKFMPRTMGHKAGMEALHRTVETCAEIKIPVLSVYAFSTENWKRPAEEVNYLMQLLVEYIDKEIAELHRNNIKIMITGDYASLPVECIKSIEKALKRTKDNTGMIFNIALNYGSRREIVKAVNSIAEKISKGEIEPGNIDEDLISSLLYTHDIPDPDLLIRTAGEMRISNFMLWQIAYTELFITPLLWPDFDRDALMQAIWSFQQRERRFGGLK